MVTGLTLAACFSIAALYLFSQNSDFPASYHPDEPSKANQILSNDYNFNHPLMMLEVDRIVAGLSHAASEEFAQVRVGRAVSAAFAALSVLAIALAGFFSYGVEGALLFGALLALCPPLLVHAHYFKEDTALVFGLALSLLATSLLCRARGKSYQVIASAFLGIGIGAASSGKFVGVLYLIPAVTTTAMVIGGLWWMRGIRTFVCGLAALITFIGVNARAFESFLPLVVKPDVLDHVKTEIQEGLSGQRYVVLPSPNAFTLRVAASDVMPHVWLLALAGVATCLVVYRKWSRWSVALAIFLSTSVVALSFCTIPFARYALPVTVCLYVAVAALICSALSRLPVRPLTHKMAFGGVLAIIIVFQGLRCLEFNRQFHDDSRQRLREWVAKNVPAGETIAADGYSRLGDVGDPYRFPSQSKLQVKVGRRFLAAEAKESYDALARSGVRYVVVAAPAYERFFAKGVRAAPGYETEFDQCRRFYSELFIRGRLLWSSIPASAIHGYTNPELRLYQISE
jgi:hypothetical protein